MLEHSSSGQSEPYVKKALGAIVGDRIWQAFFVLAIAVSLPIGTEAFRASRIDPWLDLSQLAAAVFALSYGLGRLGHPEKRFWQLWALAMSCWLVARGANVMLPTAWRGPQFDLINDCVYIVFFLLLFLAAEISPHHVERGDFDQRVRRLRLAGTTTLIFGMLVYFLVVPRHVKPDTYDSWLPRFDLYVALDLLLALAFGVLARSCANRRWSILYGLLALTALSWSVGDLLAGLARDPQFHFVLSPRLNIIWQIPVILLIGAARGRHLIKDRMEPTGERAFGARIGRPLLVAAMALPTIHLLLHSFGLGDRDLQPVRELLVLVCVLMLGIMAYVEQRWMHEEIAKSQVQRRHAITETLERSSYLDALIEQSPLAITSVDSNYRVTLCNPAFEALFGYTQEEVLEHSLLPYILPEDRIDEAWRVGNKVLEGEPVRIVTQRKHRSGLIIDVELLAVPLLVKGALVGILAFYRDLTEQVQAESARRAVEQRLRRLTEAAFEGVAILDGLVVCDANAQLATMFGYAPEAINGIQLSELVTPAERKDLRGLLEKARSRPVEIEVLRRDRTTFHVEIRARRGEETGDDFVLTIHDLSERQALEAQLQQAQKMEAIGRLAGGIAHDFNNLLTVILGRCELLSMQTSDATINGLEEIRHAAELATSLTRQLLVFARRQQPHLERFDLAAVTAATAENMLRRLIADDVTLELELSPEPAPIRADRNLIEQLIVNLGLNAQDAMREGGLLRFETAIVELEEEISAYGLEMEPGPAMRLTITDTGIGIEPDVLPNLFDPFFSTKDHSSGSGLGLATVYGIVRQSGGVIEVESVKDWGSSFVVYLPLDQSRTEMIRKNQDPDSDHSQLVSAESTSRSEVVLLVEDVPEIGTMLASFLRRQGYTVLQATLPSEALELLNAHSGKLDLLITDVVMPEMRGPQLAAIIREIQPQTKILFVSGYASAELHAEIDERAGAFLRKPYALADLLRVVRSLLNERRAA